MKLKPVLRAPAFCRFFTGNNLVMNRITGSVKKFYPQFNLRISRIFQNYFFLTGKTVPVTQQFSGFFVTSVEPIRLL